MKTLATVLATVFILLLSACQPVMPATQMPEERAELAPQPMPPTVSAEPDAEVPEETMEPITFQPSGKVLVDGITKYIEYNVADFEKAKREGRLVFIEFHAFWCPFCQRLDPIIRTSIANLNDPEIVGFRANYDTERDLRREYNVVYQHTHLIIKPDGSVTWRSLDTQWNDELFRHEIEKAKGE